jgi:hypothetical protein
MRATKKMIAASAFATGALVTTGIGVGTAVSAPSSHTLKFRAIKLTSHGFGKTSFVQTEKDVSKGKFIGNDILDAKFNPKTNGLRGVVTAAFKGGTITASVSGADPNPLTGKILSGTGKYNGISGTLTATSGSHNSENVTLVYS